MTPERLGPNGVQGGRKAAGSWVPDGQAYGKPRALTENSAGLPDVSVAEGSVFARDIPSNSLRSEPDIDTILPLPGSGALAAEHANSQSQMVNVVSPASSGEVRSLHTQSIA